MCMQYSYGIQIAFPLNDSERIKQWLVKKASNAHCQNMISRWTFTNPCTTANNDLLPPPPPQPRAILHFRRNAVSCLKGHLGV
jgi:hypothetical protein